MTEIKHIYNGMTPIYSIYDGPSVATGASNITFNCFRKHKSYLSNFQIILKSLSGIMGGPLGTTS